ncbi:MAG: peptidylprolyl isomerase [Candidatus Marinimicrobia bacterium]|jgi:peptidyl-prolyl cis-trans isomerase B (cyclophilin B)|nr:peptidylprolyl isomerase [Gammaproteobacteria bacterium]MBL6911804.1 peptidylprolyl isomerase [Candidatus Neomarinimicrobiota bacterium]MBT3944114.1 peptidylprolyl isomerase [Candidatus Neomarinimicrobiota bacterium]MBT4317010.1 peptidylprolyl isomerase [Candidatus Neomarinimicrobiota bacterium]MBT4706630.1 peptidylprolyl isomerase [Candidatus Neomarinimicrobiota bacterium]
MNRVLGLILLTLLAIGVLFMTYEKENDVAVISTNFGDMIVEFYPDIAPMHVDSFVALVNEEYFDGTTFHRVIPGFMIQGGDPNSRNENKATHGTGGRAGKFFGIGNEEDPSTWLIPQEFNDTPHVKGILSMARTNDPNSASSQFFICHDNASFLDNNYTVFGKVVEGLDIIDEIANVAKDQNDNPLERVEMLSVRIAKRSEVLSE